MQNNKNSKSAKKWKYKQLDKLIEIKNSMINNNIDQLIIDTFINDKYNDINKKYEIKVNKSLEKLEKKNKDIQINKIIRNKLILENIGYTNELINTNIKQQYYEIENINVDFID